MQATNFLSICLFFITTGCASTVEKNVNPIDSCVTNSETQAKRTQELKEIYLNDQKDRKIFESNLDRSWPEPMLKKMSENDLRRRMRVGEIFGEGCFSTAADYGYAAMVYQHGTTPDHFFQAFIWAKMAVDLGDLSQKQLMALALDRFLMNRNMRQLFGSQAKKMSPDDLCWCLWPMEKTFPIKRRLQYLDMADRGKWIRQLNGANYCPVTECQTKVQPTEKGTIPGFW